MVGMVGRTSQLACQRSSQVGPTWATQPLGWYGCATKYRRRADGWSMVRSKRWLIGYTFHHQKSYVMPTLGQPYQPNGWVAHVGPSWDERWHANCDVRPTMPTMYQRWINVLLLTGQFLREWHPSNVTCSRHNIAQIYIAHFCVKQQSLTHLHTRGLFAVMLKWHKT
jgi:hypothetical protein